MENKDEENTRMIMNEAKKLFFYFWTIMSFKRTHYYMNLIMKQNKSNLLCSQKVFHEDKQFMKNIFQCLMILVIEGIVCFSLFFGQNTSFYLELYFELC